MIKPNELTFYVLPARFCLQDYLPLYEQAYKFWHDSWANVFAQLKVEKNPCADEFLRQDFMSTILHGDKIISIHHYALFDLRPDCTETHSYLKDNFNHDFFESCRKLKLLKVMNMSSLFVLPEYRRSKSGIQLTEIIVSLGQRLFQDYTDADAIISPTRSDISVAQTAYGIGFEGLQKGVIINGCSTDLLICRRGRILPPSEESRFYVEYLWNNRTDALTGTSPGLRRAG